MKPGISVRFPVDLRISWAVKINGASKQVSWTAYINNSGTLCHLVQPNIEVLVRIKFKDSVKTYSNRYISEVIKQRLSHYINI